MFCLVLLSVWPFRVKILSALSWQNTVLAGTQLWKKHFFCCCFFQTELSKPFEQDTALGGCVLQYCLFHESKTRRHHLELENSAFPPPPPPPPSYVVKCVFLQNILENLNIYFSFQISYCVFSWKDTVPCKLLPSSKEIDLYVWHASLEVLVYQCLSQKLCRFRKATFPFLCWFCFWKDF